MNRLHAANARLFCTLLSQLGYSVLPQRVLELARGDVSSEFAVAMLRARGECARSVRATDRGLAQLKTPTLLFLSSGEACLLESVTRGNAGLRTASGERIRRALPELAGETRLAIDRGASGITGVSLRAHLFELLGSSHVSQYGLLVLGAAGCALNLVFPWLTRQALGRALPDGASSLLATLVVAVGIGAGLKAWLSWLFARTRMNLDIDLVRSASVAVFSRILRLPYAEHQKRGLGKLLQVLDSAESAARLLSSIVVTAAIEAVTILAYLACLTITVPWLGVGLASWCVIGLGMTSLVARRSARLRTEELAHMGTARASLHELIQGIVTVKTSGAEQYALLRWLRALLGERGLGLARELNDSSLGIGNELLQRFGSTAVLAWSTFAVLDGQLSVADLVYVSMLTAGLLLSCAELHRDVAKVWTARTHLERVDEVLRAAPAPPFELAPPSTLESDGPVIELHDVWFRYGPDQPWILKAYNLAVRRNEHVTLRGKTGTGKTTVLRLIAGLYRPERGTVSVLGKDPYRYRVGTAYLPQQAYLMAGSVRQNLEQLSQASIQRIRQACDATGIGKWIRGLPMQLETLLAPGGANISGGQRQWVMLTAAVASERPIVLLDEAMSQMDRALRRKLSESALFTGRTSVSVSHDS